MHTSSFLASLEAASRGYVSHTLSPSRSLISDQPPFLHFFLSPCPFISTFLSTVFNHSLYSTAVTSRGAVSLHVFYFIISRIVFFYVDASVEARIKSALLWHGFISCHPFAHLSVSHLSQHVFQSSFHLSSSLLSPHPATLCASICPRSPPCRPPSLHPTLSPTYPSLPKY